MKYIGCRNIKPIFVQHKSLMCRYGWMSVLSLSLCLSFEVFFLRDEYNTRRRQRTRIKWIKKERKLTMTRRRKKERRNEPKRKRIRWSSIHGDQGSNKNSGSLLRFELSQRDRQLFCLCTVEIKRTQISYWFIFFLFPFEQNDIKIPFKWHNQQGFNHDDEAIRTIISIYTERIPQLLFLIEFIKALLIIFLFRNTNVSTYRKVKVIKKRHRKEIGIVFLPLLVYRECKKTNHMRIHIFETSVAFFSFRLKKKTVW